VFLFNHQSQLDAIVLAKLLRGGFTAVAKKELANSPAFGALFRLADVAFVERGNPAENRKALEPAVRRLQEGTSLGHRARGHPVGDADARPVQEGRVPPRHAGGRARRPGRDPQRRRAHVAWRATIRSGVVQVRVLPPIPTGDWTVEDLDERIREVRDLYVATLANWSGRQRAGSSSASRPRTPPTQPRRRCPPRRSAWGSAPEMNPLETRCGARRRWTRGCAPT
jgi:1-acyl-sn-glycerol-3-phosphate acyltransferase